MKFRLEYDTESLYILNRFHVIFGGIFMLVFSVIRLFIKRIMSNKFDLTSLSAAIVDIVKPDKSIEETVTPTLDLEDIKELVTKHVKCPSCGGKVSKKTRSEDKIPMPVYSEGKVHHFLHIESRCSEDHCK